VDPGNCMDDNARGKKFLPHRESKFCRLYDLKIHDNAILIQLLHFRYYSSSLFFFKINVSGNKLCLRPQVKGCTQLGPIDRAISHLRICHLAGSMVTIPMGWD
jgi:hypothetical protein